MRAASIFVLLLVGLLQASWPSWPAMASGAEVLGDRAGHPLLWKRRGLQPVLVQHVAQLVRQDEQARAFGRPARRFVGDVAVQGLGSRWAAHHHSSAGVPGGSAHQHLEAGAHHLRSSLVGLGDRQRGQAQVTRAPQHVDDVLAPGRWRCAAPARASMYAWESPLTVECCNATCMPSYGKTLNTDTGGNVVTLFWASMSIRAAPERRHQAPGHEPGTTLVTHPRSLDEHP